MVVTQFTNLGQPFNESLSKMLGKLKQNTAVFNCSIDFSICEEFVTSDFVGWQIFYCP
ncbi:hypothetical protein HG66A1_37790 [Gimesia chilikensis]|uniref:Uncharacterized protein n=1 Tax=Gimesia chilikensis TaxID=2605989 RepID=A0A517PRH8_9PLAN|nr:hypothetical protein HG66A1_37790 [Gimesia chilikensis]